MNLKETATHILALADIQVNGSRPWDIKVHDERFYARVLKEGSLGLGESYMDGWWDAEKLDEFFTKVIGANLSKKIRLSFNQIALVAFSILLNRQSKVRAFIVGEKHYDAGNDLYAKMLDKRLTYTCGYWKDAQTLNEAQENKLDLICKKIGLKPGQTVLDIGCGWGSFAKFAAEKYGAHVTGVTISKEQAVLARELTKGLPVDIQLKDYRDVEGEFDHIVSIGMFEHVGYKNYKTYMEIASRNLKPGGLFLLHTIGSLESKRATDPWIDKYIFPNGNLPSVTQIGEAIENLFVMEDWHNFGDDYSRTLMAWHTNFENGWEELKGMYDERFRRMWNYYLLSCAGGFRARHLQLWQIVLSKEGVPGGYTTVR